jgi:hypothetical protein
MLGGNVSAESLPHPENGESNKSPLSVAWFSQPHSDWGGIAWHTTAVAQLRARGKGRAQ